MSKTSIYTVGYGARSIEEFLALLEEWGIVFLLDVRSKPYSRYKPDFSKDALERHLKGKGFRYVFMGDTLGGQPADPECYTPDGKVDYAVCRGKPFFQEGIGRLQQAWQQGHSVVLMCSEGKPEQCHRSKLIGPALEDAGIDVMHIDEKDRPLSQEEVMLRVIGGQPSLFGSDFHQLTSRKRHTTEDEEDQEP
ncbi:MAG TPA: DUF488 domain-containing protein [Anaerolineae bacterium]|jgi:uncharacterized protein (DUF488 family)|nr:DUF488 domain-containing protein [Anaerolineae bacterium]